MAFRQRHAVLEKAYKHFSEFGLPLTIQHKEYMAIVGAKEALCVISIKRSFKAWKYLTHALRIQYPELSAPKPEPKPEPKPVLKPVTPKAPKPAPKAAVKPAPAVKKD